MNNKSNRSGDIVTTIEPSVQETLQDQLAAVQKKWSSDLVGGVIINPKTGEILIDHIRLTRDS